MKSLLSLICLVGASGAALADPAPQHVYRLDYTITEVAAGKPAETSAYTLTLEEQDVGELKLGKNMALRPSNARVDVGLKIQAHYTTIGNDVLLQSDVEVSAAEDPTTIRKIAARGDALVTPGKPALVSSLDDPAAHKRYEVNVTVTKLR